MQSRRLSLSAVRLSACVDGSTPRPDLGRNLRPAEDLRRGHDQSRACRPAPPTCNRPRRSLRRDWRTARGLEKMRWGLVPFWRKGKPLKDTPKGAGDGFKLTTFNCKSEEMTAKPTFKHAFASRRCIVPASGWREWTESRAARSSTTFAAPMAGSCGAQACGSGEDAGCGRVHLVHDHDRRLGGQAVRLPRPRTRDT